MKHGFGVLALVLVFSTSLAFAQESGGIKPGAGGLPGSPKMPDPNLRFGRPYDRLPVGPFNPGQIPFGVPTQPKAVYPPPRAVGPDHVLVCGDGDLVVKEDPVTGKYSAVVKDRYGSFTKGEQEVAVSIREVNGYCELAVKDLAFKYQKGNLSPSLKDKNGASAGKDACSMGAHSWALKDCILPKASNSALMNCVSAPGKDGLIVTATYSRRTNTNVIQRQISERSQTTTTSEKFGGGHKITQGETQKSKGERFYLYSNRTQGGCSVGGSTSAENASSNPDTYFSMTRHLGNGSLSFASADFTYKGEKRAMTCTITDRAFQSELDTCVFDNRGASSGLRPPADRGNRGAVPGGVPGEIQFQKIDRSNRSR